MERGKVRVRSSLFSRVLNERVSEEKTITAARRPWRERGMRLDIRVAFARRRTNYQSAWAAPGRAGMRVGGCGGGREKGRPSEKTGEERRERDKKLACRAVGKERLRAAPPDPAPHSDASHSFLLFQSLAELRSCCSARLTVFGSLFLSSARCQNMDGARKPCYVRPRNLSSGATSVPSSSSRLRCSPSHPHPHPDGGSSLLDLCAKVVAFHIPFARIEERYERIPEPVQRRIIYWSFPQNESDICMYSSLASDPCSGCGQDNQKLPFYRGVRLYENNAVNNVLQVGFHLSGTVTAKSSSSTSNPSSLPTAGFSSEPERRYRVSITFDRCKITSVTCTCDAKDIFWCQHVVALALYRIRNPQLVKLRVPISETLLQLDRQQLQKLLQYLIADHHTEVLPTAQRLADEILQSQSEINCIAGAPDPTSGPCAEAEHSWHLDEDQVSEQVRSFMNQGQAGFTNAIKHLNALFGKVKEMLRAKDSNAARMLRLITEQFLADQRLPVWRSSQSTPMTDKCRVLWDQLASLWVCIVLNPHAGSKERRGWRSLLERWSKLGVCPLEDHEFTRSSLIPSSSLKRRISAIEDSSDEEEEDVAVNNNNNSSSSHNSNRYNSSNNHNHSHRSSSHRSSSSSNNSSHRNLPPPPRSIFQRALDACHLRWDDNHLRFILDHDNYPLSSSPFAQHSGSQFTSQGYPLWTSDPIPTAAARVEALRSHGYRKEALRLAVAVVRAMKRQQRDWQHRWLNEQNRPQSSSTSYCLPHTGVAAHPIHYNTEGWVGNLLDPIASLFDTLAEASLHPDSKSLDLCYSPLFAESSASSAPPGWSNSSLIDDLYLSAAVAAGAAGTPHNPNRDRPRYQHVTVPASRDRNETYLTLALECALIGLGQQRLMPVSPYAQEKARVQEEQMIRKLSDIDLDSLLVAALRKQTDGLLSAGPFSGFGIGIHMESAPMHTFARYLFTSLLPHDMELAYVTGLRAMRLPILDGIDDPDDTGLGLHNGILGRYPRVQQATLEYLQRQQCVLAGTILVSAKEDRRRLIEVSNSALRNIHSSQKLFALAECTYKYGIPTDGCPRYEHLIKTSYELGLQVMKMTINKVTYRRTEMIRWLVDCAINLGSATLKHLLDHWILYFLPMEAVKYVAGVVILPNTNCKMGLDFAHVEELNRCARHLALECIQRDPHNCAFHALELCQSDRYAFDKAYDLITLAAINGRITSVNLFTIARHIETHYPEHSYKLALLALKGVTVPYNGEQSPHLSDIHWVCSLALQMNRGDLSELISTVVANIKCAPVLSEILRRCSSTHSAIGGLPPVLTPHHPYQDSRKSRGHKLLIDKPPLRMLLEAAVSAYCETTNQRLQHISPRHYSDFIEFLAKAQETFKLSPDGMVQFNALLEHMRITYKGKKKLMCLIREKFNRETRLH